MPFLKPRDRIAFRPANGVILKCMVAPLLRKWTREEFERILAAGVVGPDERLELLDGAVVQKMTQNAPHFTALRKIARHLESVIPDGYDVRQQGPLNLSPVSMPEPDIAVVNGDYREFSQSHPGPERVQLIVEISDTTLVQDKSIKARLYGEAGIPEYWVVDLRGRRLFVFRDPAPPSVYRTTRVLKLDDAIAPHFAQDHPVEVRALLP